MRIQLRSFEGCYTICAFDSHGRCHINKKIDKEEFDNAFIFYFDTAPEVITLEDQGQSKELYEIELS